jgi:hypothetical protein
MGKWAKFIIKLYNVNEEGKATEWPTNDIPEWMKTIETKKELSPVTSERDRTDQMAPKRQ